MKSAAGTDLKIFSILRRVKAISVKIKVFELCLVRTFQNKFETDKFRKNRLGAIHADNDNIAVKREENFK